MKKVISTTFLLVGVLILTGILTTQPPQTLVANGITNYEDSICIYDVMKKHTKYKDSIIKEIEYLK